MCRNDLNHSRAILKTGTRKAGVWLGETEGVSSYTLPCFKEHRNLSGKKSRVMNDKRDCWRHG